MYAREVKGRKLTFLVSGKLWGHSLIMGDLETKSEWSHFLGTAMHGPMKGTKLKSIPSVIATWKRWKKDHPDTTVTVMKRSSGLTFMASVYERPEAYVVGLRIGDAVTAYPLPLLEKQTLINDSVAGEPVVVIYDHEGKGAMIFPRTLEEQVLEFAVKDGQVIAGGSRWSPTTGEALDGPLKGKRLEAMPAIISFADAWKRFHPQGRIYGEE